MDSKQPIEELLNKYWNCETSLEEEQQLKEYFSQEDIPDALREAAPLFRYFNEQRATTLQDDSFDKKVITRMRRNPNTKVRRLVYNTMRIAAGIVVVMAAVWFVHSELSTTESPQVVDTYNDPQKAFEETKKALLMISKSFGAVEEQAKKINLFNEAQEQIKRNGENKQEGSEAVVDS